AWSFARSLGEVAGAIVSIDENFNSCVFFNHPTTTDTLRFSTIVAGTDGNWTFPGAYNQWNAVAIRYDGSNTANDPEARVGFAPATITQIANPAAVMVTPNTGYCVGNRAANDRTWDGMLAHVQVFNVLLTDREMDQALRRPGSVRRGLSLWLPMYHAGYLADLSGNAYNGTGTDLTDAVGGPPASPLYSRGSYSPYAIAAAAGVSRAQLALLGVGV
ncbi:MAG: hypothetical protein ACREA4_13570, partial [Nitrososphaera sp.]